MRSDWYQYSLIFLGVIGTAFFSVFFYREVFPEYKIYQEDYIALEKFRSSYTHESPPQFQVGVKQILIERERDETKMGHDLFEIDYRDAKHYHLIINSGLLTVDEEIPVVTSIIH